MVESTPLNTDYVVEYTWNAEIGQRPYNSSTGIYMIERLQQMINSITNDWYYAIGYETWNPDEYYEVDVRSPWRRKSYIISFADKNDAIKFKLMM